MQVQLYADNNKHFSLAKIRIEANYYDTGNTENLLKVVTHKMVKMMSEHLQIMNNKIYSNVIFTFVFDDRKVGFDKEFEENFKLAYFMEFLELPQYKFFEESLELKVCYQSYN